MRLFSRFFRKKESTYHPVNRLETLFNEAALDPSKRPEFYRTLFHFDLLCLGQAETNPDGSKIAKFEVCNNDEGTPFIFAFTSEAALSWYLTKQKLPPRNYIGLRSHALFEMLQGMGVLLNATHDCSKYFTPFEVQEVLKDQDLEQNQVTVPGGQQFKIGQPTNLPHALVSALAGYLKKSSKVREIYFGLLAIQEGAPEFVGLVDFMDGTSQNEEDSILKDLIIVSKETLEPGKFMNFCKMGELGFTNAIESGALKALSSY